MGSAFGSCEAGKYVAWLRAQWRSAVCLGPVQVLVFGCLESCVPPVVFLLPRSVVFLLPPSVDFLISIVSCLLSCVFCFFLLCCAALAVAVVIRGLPHLIIHCSGCQLAYRSSPVIRGSKKKNLRSRDYAIRYTVDNSHLTWSNNSDSV